MSINDIVKIILAHKVIITWIVVGWLLLVFLVIKPIHSWPGWRDIVRGIGEVTLGGLWAIICAALFHPIPGLSLMLFVVFGMFHRIRQFKDKIRDDKQAARKVVGPSYAVIYVSAIILINWWMGWNLGYDFRRGVAQLTSNTMFGEAGKSQGHSLRYTGIRPTAERLAPPDTSSWFFGLSKPAGPKPDAGKKR